MKKQLLTLACIAALAGWAGLAQADTAPLRYEMRPHAFASPAQTARSGSEALSHEVRVEGAPWLRLQFKDVRLQPGSRLRITSLQDGAQQHLDAKTLKQWRNTSAYFNGSAVRVELLPAGGTVGNRFSIEQVMVGLAAPVQPESQCGGTDDRVPSNLPSRARLLEVGCTANLMANGCFITAGHCMSSPSLVNVVEFNVPASTASGGLNHPPPSDQYLPTSQRAFKNAGIGNDWGVFTVSPNSETGLMPLQAQGAGLALATSVPSVGNTVVITGYGVDNGTANQTQQVSNGPITLVNTTSTRLEYKADTEGGNSGSAVLVGDAVAAIHTNGGCSTGGSGANSGTLYTNAGFTAAFANICSGAPVGPACGDIKKVSATCSAAGKIKFTARLKDTSHDGQSLTIAIDGVEFEAPITGDKAAVSAPGFSSGQHTVSLEEPASCGAPKTVSCP